MLPLLATIRSRWPSPFRSARATAPGASRPPGGRPRRPCRRLPYVDGDPVEGLAGEDEVVAAVAVEVGHGQGHAPVGRWKGRNVPSPLPSSTSTSPKSLPTSRSSRPSRSTSATDRPVGLGPASMVERRGEPAPAVAQGDGHAARLRGGPRPSRRRR